MGDRTGPELALEHRRNAYPKTSWLDPRIQLGASPIHETGMFATMPIARGEVVVIWGGALMTRADILAGKAQAGTFAAIEEDLYLVDPAEEGKEPADFMNHSCDPNVWMKDEITLIARWDINPDEELTIDYAIFDACDWAGSWECRCGSALCRRVIQAQGWRIKAVQDRYRGHFSPVLNKRIRRLRASEL